MIEGINVYFMNMSFWYDLSSLKNLDNQGTH